MFQRMVALPYEEYAQLSGNSKINQVKQPYDQQFYDLEKEYAKQEHISNPFRRMLLQGETIDEMKALKEKMRKLIASNSPKPYRTRANALYQGLEPFLKFNERGEIFDEAGKLISDSHVEDLIQYAVRDRRRDIIPTGWPQFTSILRKHNVPRYTLNRLTLDEIDGKAPSSASVKTTPFVFTGKTPMSRREDSGVTAQQPARWGSPKSTMRRKRTELEFTPKKGRQRHSESDATPARKQSENPFDVLKRTVADFDTPPQKKKRRIQPTRRRLRPARFQL